MLRTPAEDAWGHIQRVALPRWVPVHQSFALEVEPDLAGAVARELRRPETSAELRPGMKVAVAVGSRGLAGLVPIVSTLVSLLKESGCEPFIVPAMGSHGGATAEGQTAVLAKLGITPEAVDAPICSAMDAVQIGTLTSGVPVYMDRIALQADLLVPINRVKPHTSFHGPVESGLAKMLAIGLGKHVGAEAMHSPGYDDMSERLLEALNLIKEKTTFRFGLATVENAHHEVALVQAVTSSQMPALEETLLEKARALMPRLLFDEADVLVVAEIGKNISGTGMDPNVTGRPSTGNSDFRAGKVVVLALTPEAGGNALGIGFADVTTERLVRGIDLAETWINAATSTNLPAARIPIFTPNDRTALQLALKTCGKPDPSQAHVAWIRNTLELESIYVSEALWAQLDGKADIEQTGNPEEVPFDTAGNILWPGLHWAF